MHRFFLVLLSFLLAGPALRAAEPAAELAAFSVFPNADLPALMKDVRPARGPASPVARHLSVQSCYVVPGTPAKTLETLQTWDPTRHRELKIALHMELPATPGAADFAKLANASGSDAKALAAATEKGSDSLQLSKEEAKKYESGKGTALRDFWPPLLAARTGAFSAGGAGRQPAYDFAGPSIRPGEEFSALLKGQPKIRGQFAGFLEGAGVLSGKPGSKQEYYAELLNVENEGVVTLGTFASKAVGGGFQAADALYYASGGYYVALTLYQMWPVEVGGQPATLVWRGDLISAASLGALHGIEKSSAEGVMMKDIAKAVNFLKRDSSGR